MQSIFKHLVNPGPKRNRPSSSPGFGVRRCSAALGKKTLEFASSLQQFARAFSTANQKLQGTPALQKLCPSYSARFFAGAAAFGVRWLGGQRVTLHLLHDDPYNPTH